MKLKHISAAAFSSVLLILFLPVFYCVIFIGNSMNYNEKHKIATLYNNGSLLVFALVGALLVFGLYFLLKKIPFNRYTVAGTTIFLLVTCMLFYLVNVKISKCIAFYGGWDCGMVANSARWIYEGRDLGYDDYYTIYSNNIPITWLLYKLYCISNELPNYPYNPEFIWIQFQCLIFSAAIFFSSLTVMIISKKISFSVLTLTVNCLLLGLSPWKIIPYTDAVTIATPVFIIFLYSLFLCIRSKYKYILWLFMIFAGVLGGIMKASCYVTLIAIVLVDFIWVLFTQDRMIAKMKELMLRVALLICGFLLASCCKNGMYHTLNYDYDRDTAITWTSYLYIGLNEPTTGASSQDGLVIVRAYAGYPRSVRDGFEWKYIKDRLRDKGVKGSMDFWLRKQVMNFNDGTFSWYQEGFFDAWAYEDIIDSSWEEPLQKFYWEDGESFILFNTISQGIWIFILLGVIIETILVLINAVFGLKHGVDDMEADSPEQHIRVVGILTFIGVFLFVMLFEGRARYLFNSVPVFSTMAVIGFCKLSARLSHDA